MSIKWHVENLSQKICFCKNFAQLTFEHKINNQFMAKKYD